MNISITMQQGWGHAHCSSDELFPNESKQKLQQDATKKVQCQEIQEYYAQKQKNK